VARSLSSQKRMRQNVKRAARNRTDKTIIKNELRKVHDALGGKDAKVAEATFRKTVAILDRSANKKVLHPNTAARRKSRLARRLNAMKK
jgi:small subunit ribosomal protein S20